jgi:long-subunit fatty acid transport protein
MKKLFLLLVIYFCTMEASFASVPSLYGLGSRASAMANAYTAIADDPYGWYYNPAGPAFSEAFELSIGVTSAIEDLNDFNGIVVNNNLTTGDVSANYKNSLGTVLGAILPIWKKRLNVGASIFMPTGVISRIHNADPYLPSYTFYNDRTHRMNVTLGGGWHPLEWFSVGAGLISGMTTGGTIYTDLAGSGSGETVIEVRSTSTPVVGIKTFLGAFEMGVVYRGESAGRSKTKVMVDGAPVPVEFDSTSVAFFDPQEVSTGISFNLKEFLLLQAEVTWANWSQYIPSYSATTFNTPGIPSASKPKPNFKDTLTFRLGTEATIPTFGHELKYRLGYAYIPTPIPYQYGKSNFVDNDKHIGSFGLGAKVLTNPISISTDTHFQAQYLVPVNVIKNDPNVIGGPGYRSGGFVYNFGLTLGTTF